jgi:hypothetical protein
MKVGETKFRATVYLQFSVDELDVMLFCSERHYDGRCKQASRPGGFLYGVKNRMAVDFELHSETPNQELPFHGLDVDDLDTLAKILETPPVDGARYAIGYRLHSEVVKSLRGAIDASETVSDIYNRSKA